MYCIIKCTVQGKQARAKNADLLHPSCTVVMYKRKPSSPVFNVLTLLQSTAGLQHNRIVRQPLYRRLA